jgi:hypothetical protein
LPGNKIPKEPIPKMSTIIFHQSRSFLFFSGLPKALLYACTSYVFIEKLLLVLKTNMANNVFVKIHIITTHSGMPI